MLSEILLPFLKRTFSHADRFVWLPFTFDEDKQLVTGRKWYSALLDRISYAVYLIYVVVQTFGIVWQIDNSDRVTKLNSALFNIPYIATLLSYDANQGIPLVLNIITKRSIDGDKGVIG